MSTTTVNTTAQTLRNPGCDVFIRWRPLVEQEMERGDAAIKYSTKLGTKSNTWKLKVEEHEIKNNPKFDFGNKKGRQLRPRGGFTGIGFKGIINEDENNLQTYERAIQPLVNECVLEGHTACCFAYGMTGSGKTHTMIGYGEEEGMYLMGARELIAAIQNFEANATEELNFYLKVQFAEIYNRHLYNLLNERKRSQILESLEGKVLLRETEATEDGRFLCGDLKGAMCRTPEEVAAAIMEGLDLRKSGNSSTHCQSSRSHAVIELEITTEEIENLKMKYSHLDAELTWIKNNDLTSKGYQKAAKIERKMKKNKALQKEAKAKHQALGGTLVFCDLAGSEIGSDVIQVGGEKISTGHREQQTESEKLEAKQINISLMNLAECLKNQNKNKTGRRIGYRGSSLTMFLRKYLEGKNCRTVMLAAVSPSEAYKKRTVQTLRYAKLTADTQSKKLKRKVLKSKKHTQPKAEPVVAEN